MGYGISENYGILLVTELVDAETLKAYGSFGLPWI